MFDLFAEDFHAEAVEGGEGDLLAHRLPDESLDSVPHLICRFIRKGEAQNGLRTDAGLDQVADSVDNDAGFAGTCAGKDEDPAPRRSDRLLLRLIQFQGALPSKPISSPVMWAQVALLAHCLGITFRSRGGS